MFGVALYFALLNYVDKSEGGPCIWILNPYTLNHAAWGLHRLFSPKYIARDEDLNRSYDYGELLLGAHPRIWGDRRLWETPLAIYSHQRSDRMFAQNGFFTIHGIDHLPIEEIFDNTRPGILYKVDVPRDAIPSAKEFLSFSGIDHRQLFPDLDGVASSICDKFMISR